MFKSDTQPLCRSCGKPIAKRTDWMRFGAAECEVDRAVLKCSVERPTNRKDAQRFVNGQIVAVRYSTMAREDSGERSERSGQMMTRTITVPRYIDQASVWDGESYADEFFCGGPCRDALAYACARGGSCLPAYNDAWRKRRGKVGAGFNAPIGG